MYIDKKSLPNDIISEINMRTLTLKLKQEEETTGGDFEHNVNYNDQYLIKLEMTYNIHKTRGMKWKVIGYKYIYKITEDGRILTC